MPDGERLFYFFYKDNCYFIPYTFNYIYLDNNDFMETANHLPYILSGFLLLSVFYKKEYDGFKNFRLSNWVKCFCFSAVMILLLFTVNFYMRNMEYFVLSKWIIIGGTYTSLVKLCLNLEIYEAVVFLTNIFFGALLGFLLYTTRQNNKVTRNLGIRRFLKNSLPAFLIGLIPFIVIAVFFNSSLYNIGNVPSSIFYFIFSDFMQAFQIIFGFLFFTTLFSSKISVPQEAVTQEVASEYKKSIKLILKTTIPILCIFLTAFIVLHRTPELAIKIVATRERITRNEPNQMIAFSKIVHIEKNPKIITDRESAEIISSVDRLYANKNENKGTIYVITFNGYVGDTSPFYFVKKVGFLYFAKLIAPS